jgi:phage minor structural protein
MISDIDLSLEVVKPQLQLAKPDRTIIANLTEAYNIHRNAKLGSINTLDFYLPYDKDVRHKITRNKNADLIKNRYLIKYSKGIETEWFIIINPQDTMEDSADYKAITCYSLGYELTDKIISNYSVVSKNATQILTDILQSTLWSVGSIDANFDTMYRSFSITSKDALDTLVEVATTFNALIEYDTINRKINFRILDNYGVNNHFTVSYGNLLKSATMQQSTDEFCTRLKVYGKNGATINSVNPSGSPFIENYSYFLFPFSRDANKNVLSHSDYISDSLANALLDYEALVESKSGIYQGYLTQLSTLQQTLTTQQNALTDLQNIMATIEDNLSEANATGQPTSDLIAQKNNQQALIDSKNVEIAATNSQIASVNSQITTLQNQLSVSSNFTSDQIREWNQFIIEKEYHNEYVDDPQQLLNLAKDYFTTINQPKIVVKIGIVNFWECIEEQKNWNRLNLGDIITIKHEKLGINVQAKVTEIDYDFETPDITLTISNVTELLTDEARVLKQLNSAISTSTSVNMNQYKWDKAYSDSNDINEILNNTWDATKREILASNNETVEIGRKGIIDRDLNDPNKYVVIQHGQIALTQDGGNTWKTAIKPDGIYAPQLIGQILAGVNLTITNSTGNVLINQNGMTVSDLTLSVKKSDNKSRILLDPINGLKIQSGDGTGTNWTDKLYADSSGNLILTGKLQSGEVIGGTITIGSGNSVFKATSSGIQLGNDVWGNAPFRVDMNGNATLNNLTANSATINNSNFNNGAIVGSSITVNGGVFSVNSSGYMVAQNASITGTIYATSGSLGNLSVTGTLVGGVISGATIQTSNTGRRIVLSGSQLQALNSSVKDGFTLDGSTGYLQWYSNGVNKGGIYKNVLGPDEQLVFAHSEWAGIMGGNRIDIQAPIIQFGSSGTGTATVDFTYVNVIGLNATAVFG